MKIKRVTVVDIGPDGFGPGYSIIKVECENISPYSREVGQERRNLTFDIRTPYMQGAAYAEAELGLKVDEIQYC